MEQEDYRAMVSPELAEAAIRFHQLLDRAKAELDYDDDKCDQLMMGLDQIAWDECSPEEKVHMLHLNDEYEMILSTYEDLAALETTKEDE